MKASSDYEMHLKHFSLLLTATLLGASELPNLLNDEHKEQLMLKSLKNSVDVDILKGSIIDPIGVSYSYRANGGDSDFDKSTSNTLSLNIQQDIFRSGGIYFALQYANATSVLSKHLHALESRGLIVQSLNLLLQIQKNDLLLQKQSLLVQNSQLEINRKRELFIEGALDISFLNSALLESNMLKNAVAELKQARSDLVANFANFSQVNPYKVPEFSIKKITLEAYLEHNIALNIKKSKIEQESIQKKMTFARFMPKVSFFCGIQYSKYRFRCTCAIS